MYQLYSFFNSTAERDVSALRPDELAAYNKKEAAWQAERARIEAPLREYVGTLVDTVAVEWERNQKLPGERWTMLQAEEITTITEDEERTECLMRIARSPPGRRIRCGRTML